tara:strand:+ start:423 stop:1322 length:900 start_codon:yes stop_codon:yes gene_type:complete
MTTLQKLGQKNFSNLVFYGNKNNKILILVLCSRNYLSHISSKAQKKVWTKASEEFNIIHYVGSLDSTVREMNYIKENSNKYLTIETGDEYSNIARKTLLAFEEVTSSYDFDYIFRTNTSSYINFNNLKGFISDNFEKLDYCGVTSIAEEGDKIASGAGFFLSRENIKLLLQNKEELDENLPDDVAIARMLKKFGKTPNNSKRKDLKSIPSPSEVFNSSSFHYRCRLDPQYHRILEPLLMKYIHKAENKIDLKIQFRYFLLRAIFFTSNIWILNKMLQKYYSFKFYGELHLGKKIIYRSK